MSGYQKRKRGSSVCARVDDWNESDGKFGLMYARSQSEVLRCSLSLHFTAIEAECSGRRAGVTMLIVCVYVHAFCVCVWVGGR